MKRSERWCRVRVRPGCKLNPVCRGCMAVVQGLGLDPLKDRDPWCFYRNSGGDPGAPP